MIAKTLLNHSFEATLRYVLGKEGAKLIYTNEATAVLGDALQVARSMEAIAQGRNQPCYHIALSPAQADQDRITGADWFNLCRDFLAGVGVDNHQAIAVLHTDAEFQDGEERPHLHFVINRFDSPSINAHPVCLHFPAIERVVRKLEQDYGLEAVPCSWEVDRRGDAPRQYHQSHKQQQPSAKQQLQTTLDQAIGQSTNLDEFRAALHPLGVSLRESKRGWSFEFQERHFAGYQLGKIYTQSRIEQTIANTQKPELTPEPSAIAAEPSDQLPQLPIEPELTTDTTPSNTASEPTPATPELPAASAPIAPTIDPQRQAAQHLLELAYQRLKAEKRDKLFTSDQRYVASIDSSDLVTITHNSPEKRDKISAQGKLTNRSWDIAIAHVEPEDEQNFDRYQHEQEERQQQPHKPPQKLSKSKTCKQAVEL